MDLFVAGDGTVSAIYSEAIDLQLLGTLSIARASHVEPDVDGAWFATIINGPQLGPFTKRSQAIEAEIAWLTQHRFNDACSNVLGKAFSVLGSS